MSNKYGEQLIINTDITNPNLTKIAKYMFLIEQCLFHPIPIQRAFQKLEPKSDESFEHINVYIDDTNALDYDLSEELGKKNQRFLYFITCDTRNPRFKSQLAVIKGFKGYIDCYQNDNVHSTLAVIRIEVMVKRRIPKMIESKYSEMYQQQELDELFNNKIIKMVYVYWDTKSKRDVYHDSLHILKRSEEMFDRIADMYTITDSDTLDVLSEQEFDSKYDMSKEILNYK